MKKKILALTMLLGLTCAVAAIQAEEEKILPEEPGKWEKAGQEIEDAAHAVGDATTDSSKKVWNTTKDESVGAWDTTKKKSKELWEEGKAKLHEVTAPETGTPESVAPEN
ncbi:MAG: hypothetical protein KKD01_02125 [Proteobacteria bacterium]|nr:hypothetical protein [Pseudomonadota bacterium]